MKVLQTLFVLNKVSFDEMWTYVKYRKGEKRTSIWIWTAILHESLHSNIRHYLARFKRNTLSYSKSTEMISLSLALFFIDKELI
jgi:IS1 family transposase